ncbi:MAG: hypothetical protein GF329_00215 [Candidatus Lokiarchaeota archaeon]|nr:hypothetical protein [Candidatus Lokiarchaeota archaeon]
MPDKNEDNKYLEEDNEDLDDEDEDEITDEDIKEQTDDEIDEERKEIDRLGLGDESDKAFTRLFNKEDQKKEKKRDKKPPPEFFL